MFVETNCWQRSTAPLPSETEPRGIGAHRGPALAGRRRFARRDARSQRARGQWVVVSQGKHAVWASSISNCYRLQPPTLAAVINPIGCGDCLAAGIAWGLRDGAKCSTRFAWAWSRPDKTRNNCCRRGSTWHGLIRKRCASSWWLDSRLNRGKFASRQLPTAAGDSYTDGFSTDAWTWDRSRQPAASAFSDSYRSDDRSPTRPDRPLEFPGL